MYAYIDETGDTGFQFDKNSSTHFAVAVVTAKDSESVQRATMDARRQLRWPADREFKFSGTSDHAKTIYFRAIRRASFQIYATVFDKRRLNSKDTRQDFYGHLLGLCLEDLVEVLTGAHLILDESFKGRHKQRTFRTELRSHLMRPERRKMLRNLSYRGSHTDDMLQLADMAVGAIARAHKRQDEEYRRLIEARIYSECLYP